MAVPRVLFHCPSRRGLGHVMRSANLARAVQDQAPEASVLVMLASDAAGGACDGVPWVAADPSSAPAWHDVVATFAPTLAVFDTALPQPWAAPAIPRAFVWRAMVADRHAATAADPRLRQMAAILVPHHAPEFPHAVPPEVLPRVTFAGPIVRGSDAEGQARVRARYRLAPGDLVVVSTVGGGGFDDSAAWLLDLVFAAHRQWQPRLPRLRHIVVRGPLAAGSAPDAPAGLTLVDADPDLVHLFAIADLVVAEAGYNTVHELRRLGVPALLAPGVRAWDDQAGRARALDALGLARVVDRSRFDRALETLVALGHDRQARDAMRRAAQAHPLDTGNRRAADALLRVAS